MAFADTLARLRHPFRRARLSRGFTARSLSVHPFDTVFGVNTSGMIPASRLVTGHAHDPHNTAYYAIAPSLFRALCRQWLAGPLPAPPADYTFIDMGAGKGRAVLMAAEFRFRNVIGVELHRGLARIARRNLRRWRAAGRALSPARIVCQDAAEFAFPPGHCLVYAFHPFDETVFRRLIGRIEEAFAARPGQLDLVYVNAEYESLLDQHPAFTRLWRQSIPISPGDADFDRVILSSNDGEQYGVRGDEICGAWRWTGIPAASPGH